MKKMTTGSDLKINDIGSPLLHKHHKVDVEDAGNGFARSKVKDQLFIDHLLILYNSLILFLSNSGKL